VRIGCERIALILSVAPAQQFVDLPFAQFAGTASGLGLCIHKWRIAAFIVEVPIFSDLKRTVVNDDFKAISVKYNEFARFIGAEVKADYVGNFFVFITSFTIKFPVTNGTVLEPHTERFVVGQWVIQEVDFPLLTP